MRLIVGLNFDFDGLDKDFPDELRKYLLAALESGAEATCSEISIDGVYYNEHYTVISRKTLEKLEKSEEKLEALEAMGVDNWSGYSDAMRALKEGLEDFEWE